MEIHLIGPLPPPFGGVSVHIARLRKRLLRAGHTCVVWSHEARPTENVCAAGSLRQMHGALRKVSRSSILHFHENHLLAGLMAAQGRKVVFTVHNERVNTDLRGGRFPLVWLHHRVARRCFLKVGCVIAISEWVRDELVKFGFDRRVIRVVCSYLRPEEDEAAHPANMAAFLAFRQRFGQVVTASAWALRFFRGEDLYGIDLSVEMMGRLKDRHPDLGLVLVLPGSAGEPYLAELQRRAEALGIGERILWLLESGAYHPIQRRCELVLRPTNTDGFGVVMAEAMEFGVPVIASDAVHRPAACVLFRNRDAADLAEKVSEALADLSALRERVAAQKERDHFDEVCAVYEEFAG